MPPMHVFFRSVPSFSSQPVYISNNPYGAVEVIQDNVPSPFATEVHAVSIPGPTVMNIYIVSQGPSGEVGGNKHPDEIMWEKAMRAGYDPSWHKKEERRDNLSLILFGGSFPVGIVGLLSFPASVAAGVVLVILATIMGIWGLAIGGFFG